MKTILMSLALVLSATSAHAARITCGVNKVNPKLSAQFDNTVMILHLLDGVQTGYVIRLKDDRVLTGVEQIGALMKADPQALDGALALSVNRENNQFNASVVTYHWKGSDYENKYETGIFMAPRFEAKMAGANSPQYSVVCSQ